jgi:hypothetical protein
MVLRLVTWRPSNHGLTSTCSELAASRLPASEKRLMAECFKRIGGTAAKLTELAVLAEHNGRGDNERGEKAKKEPPLSSAKPSGRWIV